jgi:hypothetical protein
MSTLAEAILINVAVLISTLQSDLGRRKVTLMRFLRPVIVVAVVVPLFMTTVFTSGIGLTTELAGLAAGVLVGAVAVSLMKFERDESGVIHSTAGTGYAALWIVIAAARTLFSIGASNWFGSDLGRFFFEHGAKVADIGAIITDGLIGMALAMILTRTAGLYLRGRKAVAVRIDHALAA